MANSFNDPRRLLRNMLSDKYVALSNLNHVE